MIRAGSCGQQFQRDLAVGGFEDFIALRAQPHPQQFADRRLVVDDQNLDRRGVHAAVSSAFDAGRDRQPDGQHGAAAVGAVGGGNRAVHRLDKAAGNREPKAGAGADMIALLRAIELVEHALQFRRRNALAFVDDLQR